ncbi:hypothetical protein PFICI_14065 [Pestalotiopsis fici W106-1]|uniref:DUF6594 domain-containing protein n=1 Tax=Pestalotiopsis fici (strain W106-1 / CGMCC3.15140) TaxID=1229662 RepID=W3WK92_PESFW|nr:uncharacterized protein PFICI_14065 [Pestalotiopsis fici W106-1]ETS74199.1 hypothetical protein PFICI_14065 [Pestalotiopsis fici W106-1]
MAAQFPAHIDLNTLPADTGPTSEEVQRKPWKFVGYRGYADFIASDDDFYMLRRFNTLHVRVSLSYQDRIAALEEQLTELDAEYSRREAEDVDNGTFRHDQEDRQALLDNIGEALYQYSKKKAPKSLPILSMALTLLDRLVLQQSELRKLPPALKKDVKSVKNWHFNHDHAAVAAAEQKYLDHEADLFSMATTKGRSPLRQVIDSSLRLRTLGLWSVEKANSAVPAYDSGNISYYSDKRIDAFVSGLIVLIGITMLITPIWILQSLNSMQSKLFVITVFILVFLLVLSLAMVAKPFEALGTTAA